MRESANINNFLSDVRKDGRKCKMEWDSSKPNGTPHKLCDVLSCEAVFFYISFQQI